MTDTGRWATARPHMGAEPGTAFMVTEWPDRDAAEQAAEPCGRVHVQHAGQLHSVSRLLVRHGRGWVFAATGWDVPNPIETTATIG